MNYQGLDLLARLHVTEVNGTNYWSHSISSEYGWNIEIMWEDNNPITGNDTQNKDNLSYVKLNINLDYTSNPLIS